MELGIETIVDGIIEEKGIIALDAKIFYEIIRRLRRRGCEYMKNSIEG